MVKWGRTYFSQTEGTMMDHAFVDTGSVYVWPFSANQWRWEFWSKDRPLKLAAEGTEPTKKRAQACAIAASVMHSGYRHG